MHGSLFCLWTIMLFLKVSLYLFQSFKTPTSVLMDEDNKCIAFGFDAEAKYSEQAQSQKLLLFKNFKMVLHKVKVILKSVFEKSISLKT